MIGLARGIFQCWMDRGAVGSSGEDARTPVLALERSIPPVQVMTAHMRMKRPRVLRLSLMTGLCEGWN
ncbi:MAG: hypothetical protein EWM72_02924 [Nitrospira sp.]|nr:MAG: hypothetical protein EWM72_02924 [Nitrospira sp.]